MNSNKTGRLGAALLASGLLAAAPLGTAVADSGFYLGGSVGSATVQADVSLPLLPVSEQFDENDTGYKIFGGYNFDLLPVFDLGIEASYTDLGNPSGNVLGEPVSIDTTAFTAYGLASVGLGPIDLFGKVGFVNWESEGRVSDVTFSDDGSDAAYGLGLRFGLGPVSVRGEYEIFDISDVDDVYMVSVGISWMF